jgi:translocation and assembly module TamB
MASFRFSPPRALALAAALLAILGFGFFVAASFAADEEKGVLADVLSRALSTPATEVSIGSIDGALSSDATVRDLKISDRDGVWLTVNRIRIIWRRLALLQRRLEIDKLDIDQMNVARKPIPAEAPVSGGRPGLCKTTSSRAAKSAQSWFCPRRVAGQDRLSLCARLSGKARRC